MTDQLSLFGGPAASVEMPRLEPAASGYACELFFAVQPEPEDADRISAQALALRRALNLHRGSVVGAPRLHVSLYGLGSHIAPPESVLARALDAASQVRLPPFEMAFDQLRSFGRPERKTNAKSEAHPLVLESTTPLPGLQELRLRLGMALADAGESVKQPFHPHMTLSWHDALILPQPLEPLRWTARRWALIWSHVGKTRYERAGEWLLGA